MSEVGASGGDGGGPSLAVAVLDDAAAAVRGILSRPGYAFSDAEVLAGLRSVNALAASVEAVFLGFVQELQSRPGVIGGMPGSKGAHGFLTEVLRRSGGQAGRDLRAAEALGGGSPALPAMAAALAAGEVNREHVDVAVSAVRRSRPGTGEGPDHC